MDTATIEALNEFGNHRFVGYFVRLIDGQPSFIYRCVCGYIEAAPINGGPARVLDARFIPRPNARQMVAHLHLERAHELN